VTVKIDGAQVLAALNLYSRAPRSFTAVERDRARGFADRAAGGVAIAGEPDLARPDPSLDGGDVTRLRRVWIGGLRGARRPVKRDACPIAVHGAFWWLGGQLPGTRWPVVGHPSRSKGCFVGGASTS
jgi:hypothetical protein